jgi:hypothetical protein
MGQGGGGAGRTACFIAPVCRIVPASCKGIQLGLGKRTRLAICRQIVGLLECFYSLQRGIAEFSIGAACTVS